MVTRKQLFALGLDKDGVDYRVARGRLHIVFPGVYKVGTPDVSQLGLWMAAILKCGSGAVISHEDAAILWGLRRGRGRREVHVTIRRPSALRTKGIRIHRRSSLRPGDITHQHGIPVITPAATIIDNAVDATAAELDRMISDADARGLCTVERIRDTAVAAARRPGAKRVRDLIHRRTFRFRTRSGLERAFLPLAKLAGLPPPLTRRWVNGYEVDFFWPDLGLVVETDGGRFHRSPGQQTRDRLRDQAHFAAGLLPLRFTEEQVAYTPAHVVEVLEAAHRRLRAAC
jgi:Protein of unknown function (DUF559)